MQNPPQERMRRVKLTIQYNGTPFHGFQRVNEAPSVQATIEAALKKITQEDITLKVAGRTDKGVHALGQVAHFDTESTLPLIKFLDGIPHYTRPHIAITRVEEVENDFHARHTATARTYIYKLAHSQRHQEPTLVNRAGHVPQKLNVAVMQAAIKMFPCGEIDCSSFRSSECQSSTPMVLMHSMALYERSAHELEFKVSANHFLHNMIRILMGTLVEIGLERMPKSALIEALAAKNRQAAGPTFAPDGLYLAAVTYPDYKTLESCPE